MPENTTSIRTQILLGVGAIVAIGFALWRLTGSSAESTADEGDSGGDAMPPLAALVETGSAERLPVPDPEDLHRRAGAHVADAVNEALAAPWPPLPEAPSSADNNRQRTAWRARMMRDTYEQHGIRSADWDQQAREFLRQVVIQTAPGAEPTAAELTSLAAAGKALDEAGCVDPWIRYNRAFVLLQSGGDESAESLLRSAVTGLAASNYPHLFRFYAMRRLSWLLREQYGPQHGEAAAFWDAALEQLGLAAADPHVLAGGQRSYAMDVEAIVMATGDLRDLARIQAAMESTDAADPWLLALLRQRLALAHAWQPGEGSPGVPADAASVQARLEEAYADAAAAYPLHPEFPEIAVGLLQLCLGLERRAEAREWFYRAVTAEFDCSPAFDTMVMGTLPGAGGSPADSLAFAILCADSGRFDTLVPHRFLDVAHILSLDYGDDWRLLWRHVDVARRVDTICRAYATEESASGLWHPARYTSVRALAAWAAGDYPGARTLLRELGNRFDPMAYPACFPLARPRVLEADLALGCGDLGEAWRQVREQIDSGRHRAALAALPQAEALTADNATAVIRVWEELTRLPLGEDAEINSLLVDRLLRLEQHERLLLRLADARLAGHVPSPELQSRINAALGDVHVAFAACVPPAGTCDLESLESGLAAVDALTEQLAADAAIEADSARAAELETASALARLRWLLSANFRPEAVPQAMSTVVLPQFTRIHEFGILIDFIPEHLQPGRISGVLAPHIAQLFADMTRRQAAVKYSVTAARLATLSEADAAALPAAFREVFQEEGSLRLGLAAVHLLQQRGHADVAAVLKAKIDAWLWQLFHVTRGMGPGGAWTGMATYNLVRGYEEEVILYGCHTSRYEPLQSALLIMADAWVREEHWERAASMLLQARSRPDEQSGFHTPDGTYDTAQAYANATLEQILQAEGLSPRLRTELQRVFPEVSSRLPAPSR